MVYKMQLPNRDEIIYDPDQKNSYNQAIIALDKACSEGVITRTSLLGYIGRLNNYMKHREIPVEKAPKAELHPEIVIVDRLRQTGRIGKIKHIADLSRITRSSKLENI